MGILRLPHSSDFWSLRKPLFRTTFNNIMPRDRFSTIWRYLHLHNNQAPPPQHPDKLTKLRWLFEYLNQTFTAAYTPYENISVDESMIKVQREAGIQAVPAGKTCEVGRQDVVAL